MKKALLLLMTVVFAVQLYAQNTQEGIKFTNVAWKEVLAAAKKENKLVFVDIYTEWCGPCKQMVKDVFPQKPVGDLFNASFVNYKIDAEKGEGIQVAKSFAVNAYPTYLFVNGDGQLVYKFSGAMPAADFMQKANVALKEASDPKTIAQWTQEYESGKRDKDFLLSYVVKKAKVQQPTAEAIEVLISQLSDEEIKSNEILSTVMYGPTMEFVPGGKFCQYVLKNYKNGETLKTASGPLANLQHGMRNYFIKNIIPGKKADMLVVTIKVAHDIGVLQGSKDLESTLKGLEFDYYKGVKDETKLVPAAREYVAALLKVDTVNVRKAASIAYAVRNVTETMYKLVSDKATLTEAVQWGKIAHEYYPHFSTSGVYAGILYKSGDMENAVKILEGLINKTFFVNPGLDRNILFKENIEKMKKGELPEKLWNI